MLRRKGIIFNKINNQSACWKSLFFSPKIKSKELKPCVFAVNQQTKSHEEKKI